MIDWYAGIRALDRERYTKEVAEMVGSGVFRRLPANIPNLWVPDDTLTNQWCQIAPPPPPSGGRLRWTCYSVNFNMLLCSKFLITQSTLNYLITSFLRPFAYTSMNFPYMNI